MMNILITGSSGFIGGHITAALINEGYRLSVCVRNAKSAQQRWPQARVITADFSRDHDIAGWAERLKGIDVVINAVGIIREVGSQTFKSVHTDAPCALFKACTQAGVEKVIQISALGADEAAYSQYHLSKRAADECLMAQDLNWSILMPSIVYGPGAKSMAFFRALAALPLTPIVDMGDQAVQPVHIDDLVRVVLRLAEPSKLNKLRVEIVGPEPVTIKEIYLRLRHWLGMGRARFVSIPYRLALLAGYFGGFLGNAPMTKESIQMLRRGNTADATHFIRQFGFIPISFEESLKRTPSQQADCWHARLYFLKPLLRLSIAFLWCYTGVVSAFVFPVDQSYFMLSKAGITGFFASAMLYGAAAIDVALGIATLIRYRLQLVGLIQIAVIILYTIVISLSQPEYWVHPFGAISKNIPLIVAIMVMLALEKK